MRVKNEVVPDADLLLAAVAGNDDDYDDMQSVISSGEGKGVEGRVLRSRRDSHPRCVFSSYFLYKTLFTLRYV